MHDLTRLSRCSLELRTLTWIERHRESIVDDDGKYERQKEKSHVSYMMKFPPLRESLSGIIYALSVEEREKRYLLRDLRVE
jgi:hypothetical protein